MRVSAAAKEKKRLYDRRYYQEHKEQKRLRNQRYHCQHAEAICARARKHRLANKEYYKEYRQRNAGKRREEGQGYYQAHLEEIRERHRKYRQTEKGRAAEIRGNQKRTARKAGLPCTFTEEHWEVALAHFANVCAYCGVQDGPLQQDHVIAVSLGGGYVAANIVPACKSCNSSKNNMPLDEWVVGRGAQFVLPDVVARVTGYLESTGVSQ